MFAACMSLCKGEFKRRIRALTVTGALVVTGAAIVLVAIGFGLSLLYVWLQQLYGTMPALGIIAGGCAVSRLDPVFDRIFSACVAAALRSAAKSPVRSA